MTSAPESSSRPDSDSPKIILWASIMASGTLLSRVLGLIRDMLIAAIFPRYVSDAWTVAFRLPNLFRRLLGEGSLSVSFIPVFVRLLHKSGNDHREAQHLVSSLFTLLCLILTGLTFIFVIWMDPIMRLLVGGAGYAAIAGKTEMTVKMAQIMFPFIFLMSLYAYFMAILNSFKRFALGALAPCLLNLTLIAATFIPANNLNDQAYYQSWAVIIGGILQMGLLIPQIIALGYFPKFHLDFSSGPMREIFKAFLPSMFGMSIVQLTGVVNVYFASRLPQGTHTYIYLADRILELPLSLFAVSLGSALLPTLSSYWAKGEKEKMLQTSAQNLRLIFFIAIPCSAAFYFYSQPIVEVLFMRKEFNAADVQATTDVLRVYSLTVLTASAVRILAPCFYAISNTKLPAASAAASLVVHILIAPGLINKLGLVGLPWSTVISAGFNMVTLFIAHQCFIGKLRVRNLFSGIVRFAIASAFMVFFLEFAKPLYFAQTTFIGKVIYLSGTIFGACLIYFAGSLALRVEETQAFAAIALRKLRLGRKAI
jgi:putative peptidoglycan lipid II flippase